MRQHLIKWARRLTACVFCSVIVAGLYAVPAYRGWQTKTLPDGSTVRVRQIGDEFFHFWEDEQGVPYVHDAAKGWAKAEQPVRASEESKAIRASMPYHQQDMSQPRRVSDINMAPRGLVILVNFADVSFHSSNTREAMWELMNGENYTYAGAIGSTREYYRAQSNGKYVPDFDVVGPYTLPHTRAYYGANLLESERDTLPCDMIVEACQLAYADGVDFTLYNNNGDSYVDFVYVIYAGAGEADSDVSEAIWPQNWLLSSARYYHNCTYSSSQCKVGNLYIENYACSGELQFGQAGTRCPIGTIAHEFGHVLGLPDYYVTVETASNYDMDYTPGAWSIMDYGSYNNDGNTPPNYSAYDKYFFGWMTPTLLAKDAQVKGRLTTAYTDAYQITGDTERKAATSTQRLWYIENRQKTGWDAYLPGHGMIAWEVTYNASNWKNNRCNNEKVGYTVVTAGNLNRPYKPYVTYTTTSSTSSTPFPGNANVRAFTPATGCAITAIDETDSVITFLFNGGPTEYSYELLGDHCTVPDDGTVELNGTLSLTIVPDAGYTLADAECWTVEMGSHNELVYGIDFTYNELTNEFRIEQVTDDVVILVEAKLNPGTGIGQTKDNPASVVKALRCGQMVIIRGNKVYTMTGLKIED